MNGRNVVKILGWSFAFMGVLAVCQPKVAAAMGQDETSLAVIRAAKEKAPEDVPAEAEDSSPDSKRVEKEVIIKRVEPASKDEAPARKVPWLGVATDEASEALAAQLGLAPGVGLVTTFVAPDSPAAKAGLKKNDVLVEFAGQELVHPSQLRKLVRVRKEGDEVPLVLYRAGKRQQVTATLGKTNTEEAMLREDHEWQGDFKELQRQLKDLPIREVIREQMKTLRESMGNLKIDQQKVQDEVRRSLEQARKALEHALREATNAASKAAGKALREIEKSDVRVDDNATVTVRSTGDAVKSTVVSDDSGTIVVVSNPTPHLTAHNKKGKLIFDGEIATDEQKDKVPRDLWKKVEPLLEKMQGE